MDWALVDDTSGVSAEDTALSGFDPEAHVLFDEQRYFHGELDARSDSVPNSVVGQFASSLALGAGRRSPECREFRIHELGDSCL